MGLRIYVKTVEKRKYSCPDGINVKVIQFIANSYID
jgi:hypothetical protein